MQEDIQKKLNEMVEQSKRQSPSMWTTETNVESFKYLVSLIEKSFLLTDKPKDIDKKSRYKGELPNTLNILTCAPEFPIHECLGIDNEEHALKHLCQHEVVHRIGHQRDEIRECTKYMIEQIEHYSIPLS